MENNDFMLHLKKRYTDQFSASHLSWLVSSLYKKHCFVEYTLRKCFNSFVQSALDVGRHKEKNPNSSVIAETTKLLLKSYHGYQTMDRSRQTLTKYLNDEKTHATIDSKLFGKQTHVNKAWFEIELVKAEI